MLGDDLFLSLGTLTLYPETPSPSYEDNLSGRTVKQKLLLKKQKHLEVKLNSGRSTMIHLYVFACKAFQIKYILIKVVIFFLKKIDPHVSSLLQCPNYEQGKRTFYKGKERYAHHRLIPFLSYQYRGNTQKSWPVHSVHFLFQLSPMLHPIIDTNYSHNVFELSIYSVNQEKEKGVFKTKNKKILPKTIHLAAHIFYDWNKLSFSITGSRAEKFLKSGSLHYFSKL